MLAPGTYQCAVKVAVRNAPRVRRVDLRVAPPAACAQTALPLATRTACTCCPADRHARDDVDGDAAEQLLLALQQVEGIVHGTVWARVGPLAWILP